MCTVYYKETAQNTLEAVSFSVCGWFASLTPPQMLELRQQPCHL